MEKILINVILSLFVYGVVFFTGYVYGVKKEFERTIKMFDDWLEELEKEGETLEKRVKMKSEEVKKL